MAITIDFKNVGSDYDMGTAKKLVVKPIGIKTPIRRGTTFGLFDMHTNPLEQIKDNLKNLILTNNGERVILTDYGANLRSILFMMSSELTSDVVTKIAIKIKEAVDKYMPYVELDNLEVTHSSVDATLPRNVARIRIGFQVPGLTIKNGELVTFPDGPMGNELDLFLNLG